MVQTSSNICLKKCLVQGLILDVNEDVNGGNKFIHLFKEMFEGPKFDIGC